MVCLARPDGTPTGNVREMDELSLSAECPSSCTYVARPKPDLQTILARSRWHLQRVPMLMRECKRLQFMHPTVLGLDGWSQEGSLLGLGFNLQFCHKGAALVAAVPPRNGRGAHNLQFGHGCSSEDPM